MNASDANRGNNSRQQVCKTVAQLRLSKIPNEGVLNEDKATKDRNAPNALIQRF